MPQFCLLLVFKVSSKSAVVSFVDEQQESIPLFELKPNEIPLIKTKKYQITTEISDLMFETNNDESLKK